MDTFLENLDVLREDANHVGDLGMVEGVGGGVSQSGRNCGPQHVIGEDQTVDGVDQFHNGEPLLWKQKCLDRPRTAREPVFVNTSHSLQG